MKEKFSSIVDWLSDPEPIHGSNAGPTVEDGMSDNPYTVPADDSIVTFGPGPRFHEANQAIRERRLDRLCVIVAGVAGGYQFERYLLKDAVEDVATISRAILAKLEEE